MEKSIYRACVRIDGGLVAVFLKAEDISLAISYVKEVPGVTEIINISEEENTIIL